MTLALYVIVLVVFAVTFTMEVIAPASGAFCDKRWQLYAGALSAVQVAFTLAAGLLFRETFESVALLPLPSAWPAPAVGFLAFLLASFIGYWWHRAEHHFDTLWRVFHQLHHSPARVESLTAFYMHPFDGIAATLISAIAAYLVFGASAAAAGWTLLYAALNNLLIHTDLATPRWLGPFFQRPEMHRVHHKRGHHAQNYGLPVWDLLFGTYSNPRDPVLECGFDPDNERRIRAMLLLRKLDV